MVQRDSRIRFIAALFGIIVGASCLPAQNPVPSASQPIQLLISLKQPFVAEPEPARIVLHIHNPTSKALWLYRRARGKRPPEAVIQEENRPLKTSGGSTVEVALLPADASVAHAVVTAAEATVLEYVQMPKPRLIKLAAGADYEETSVVHLQPALAEGQKPIWGKYQLTLNYAASFSNGDIFRRILDTDLWQGQMTSNAISVDLRPALPDAVGEVNGTTVGGQDLQPRAGIRVSLSDAEGQLIDQQVTEAEGRYSFTGLPMGRYWITGRWDVATRDTMVFRHTELTHDYLTATTQLVLYPPEGENPAALHDPRLEPIMTPVSEGPNPRTLVHKPVLVRVFDSSHKPLGGINIDAIYSSEDVIDDVKAVTSDDGTVAMELLPGRISLSLKQHGCQEQSERADVSAGVGVDGFRYVVDCVKK
jgi:hypothetical protein